MDETRSSADSNTTTEDSGEQVPAGLEMNDPTDTEHPVGEGQAAENEATESPT